ncbi:MAG: hypothetical protein K6E51_08680 [Treponema sp.]|nr:hypothetical protein [Treponema sp.]
MISVYNYVKTEKTPFTDIVNAFLPTEVTIPFDQEFDVTGVPVITAGDVVTEGQIIASSDACTVHSSLPGIVNDVFLSQLPNGKECLAAKIRLNGNFSYRGKRLEEKNVDSLTSEAIIKTLSLTGVVNTFNSNKPVSLSRQLSVTRDLLIVRLFDEDPGCMVDTTLGNIKFNEIKKAVALLLRAMNGKGIVFLYSKENTKVSDQSDDTELFGNTPVRYVKMHAEKYPDGFKRDLYLAIKHSLPEEPFKSVDMSCLYVDALTLVHVYEAVYFDMPVIHQYVQVTSSCLNSTGIFKICIGTNIGSLIELCGGLRRPIKKIVINGIIIGCSVSSFAIPITSYTKQITFIPRNEISDQRQTTCIRCGNCRNVCPRGLYPDILYNHIARSMDIDEIYLKTSNLCSECALCNAFCPSRLPLTQTIALLKDKNDE